MNFQKLLVKATKKVLKLKNLDDTDKYRIMGELKNYSKAIKNHISDLEKQKKNIEKHLAIQRLALADVEGYFKTVDKTTSAR